MVLPRTPPILGVRICTRSSPNVRWRELSSFHGLLNHGILRPVTPFREYLEDIGYCEPLKTVSELRTNFAQEVARIDGGYSKRSTKTLKAPYGLYCEMLVVISNRI